MASTFRCFCGHINRLPENQAEAAQRRCPGCGLSLLYLYDARQNEERIMAELREARRRRLLPGTYHWLAWLAIAGAFVLKRPTSFEVIGRGEDWPWTWMIGWAISILLVAVPANAYINVIYIAFTGKEYVEDRVAFAEAGCFDLAAWSPVAGFVIAYAAYWLTWTKVSPDPISGFRTPTAFVGAYAVALVLCMALGGLVLFPRRGRGR